MTKAQRVEYKQTDKGVVPVYADQIIEQPSSYTDQDHYVWAQLLERQTPLVEAYASTEFLNCLQKLPLGNKIPQFNELNEFVAPWKIVAVNGLLSDVAFFDLLSKKQFPATWWIRKQEQLEYIQEPDLFHDLFGHVPLLMNEQYSELMQLFGQIGSGPLSHDPKFMEKFARLYWFSVEFGLIKEKDQLKVFGAGLMSSPGEIIHSLSPNTDHRKFKQHHVVNTSYKIDSYQPAYYYCQDLNNLLMELLEFQQKNIV